MYKVCQKAVCCADSRSRKRQTAFEPPLEARLQPVAPSLLEIRRSVSLIALHSPLIFSRSRHDAPAIAVAQPTSVTVKTDISLATSALDAQRQPRCSRVKPLGGAA